MSHFQGEDLIVINIDELRERKSCNTEFSHQSVS